MRPANAWLDWCTQATSQLPETFTQAHAVCLCEPSDWLAYLIDWSLRWTLSALPASPSATWSSHPQHSLPISTFCRVITSVQFYLPHSMLSSSKSRGSFLSIVLPSAPCSVPGSGACGESVDGMVLGKLPLRCDRNLPYFLIPKCFIVWSYLEGPRKTLSASPKVPCIFSSLHGYPCLSISRLLHSAISTPAFPSSTSVCHPSQEAFPDNLTDISPFWLLLLFTLHIWAFTYKPSACSVIHRYILCTTCHKDY